MMLTHMLAKDILGELKNDSGDTSPSDSDTDEHTSDEQ